MIQLSDIHLQLGTKVLLESGSLTIYPGQNWGLIGQNGSGKSSLFSLLLGDIQEDQGQKHVPKDWQISHMSQEIGSTERVAIDFVLDGDPELRALEEKISQSEDGEKLAHLYEQMESIDGYSAKARAQQLLHGLGFNSGDDERAVADFSGGWRIRLNLAQALMCRSDCLLLDEPTNHLDLDATIWLERWLKGYSGTLIIVSHDRDFLDSVVENIVSVENKTLNAYSGNYSSYEIQKAERLALQAAAFKKQQERISEIENFVRRFRAKATKAKQAQSRLKELERMELIAPAHVESPFNFRFTTPEKIPQSLLNLSEVNIGYSSTSKPLVSNIELNILSSSRIGLLGSNGAGKSTLMKTLAAELPLLSGFREENTHLSIGYFNQHQLEVLDLEASCALHLQRISPSAREQEIRNFLGGFGFSGDRAFEPIRHFSGGEKARLALAIIAWQKPNLLLLDEPTNHLDLEMRHALTVALQTFEGAIVVVSHDRHLLRNTVDSFILVDGGRVESFEGTLEDYQSWLLGKETTEPEDTEKNVGTVLNLDKKAKRQSAAAAREKLKPLTNEIKKLDKEIEKLQTQMQTIEKALANPDLYDNPGAELEELLKKQSSVKRDLSEKEEQWMEKSEELEDLKND